MRLKFHDLREVLQGLGGQLEDVGAAPGAARFLDLLEGAAQLSELPEVVVRLQLEGHETVVSGVPRELNRTGVAVQVLLLPHTAAASRRFEVFRDRRAKREKTLDISTSAYVMRIKCIVQRVYTGRTTPS